MHSLYIGFGSQYITGPHVEEGSQVFPWVSHQNWFTTFFVFIKHMVCNSYFDFISIVANKYSFGLTKLSVSKIHLGFIYYMVHILSLDFDRNIISKIHLGFIYYMVHIVSLDFNRRIVRITPLDFI